MRSSFVVAGPIFAVFIALGCGAAHASHAPRGTDSYSRVAAAELATPCEAVSDAGPLPSTAASITSGPDGQQAEVVAYFPHPYDEALFAAGTLTQLGHGGHKTVVVFLSHGEGGRVLELNGKGEFVERYDLPKDQIAQTRDRETEKAASAMNVEAAHLYEASANADFGKTLSCAETLEKWEDTLPGGIANVIHKLVDDIRTRRPRVVITSPSHDDGGWFEHGHNKAFGALVEIATRMAANPRVIANENPHVVEELLAIAPNGGKADVVIVPGEGTRRRALSEYPSQFRYDKVADTAGKKAETFVSWWHATGIQVPAAGSILADLVAHPRNH